MTPLTEPTSRDRFLSWIPFVASAALVAFAVHLAIQDPWWGLALGAFALTILVPAWLQRRRLRRLLESGNVDAVLEAYRASLEDAPYSETMAPLVRAAALAAHGFTDRARQCLARARRGPAWEAALEHRLLIETLLDAFEGERERALERAETLRKLPLPTSLFLRGRVQLLRSAMRALARAFLHRAGSDDVRTLEAAARHNPLVHWPMRYAAAVARLDRGQQRAAARLLAGAPEWPEDSVFSSFHTEILERAGQHADGS